MTAFKALLFLSLFTIQSANAQIRGCHVNAMSRTRSGIGKMEAAKYIPGLCTHIFYGYTTFDTNYQFSNHEDPSYAYMKEYKMRDPTAKVLMSVGGPTFSTALFSHATGSAQAFAKKAVEHAKHFGFHGIDIDWQQPLSTEKEKFNALLKILKVEASKDGLLVTASVKAGRHYADSSYNFAEMVNAVDFLNYMTYDFDSWKTNQLGYSAPLNSGPNGGVIDSINYIISKGFPAAKIVMGIQSTAYGWNLPTTAVQGLGAQATGKLAPGKIAGLPNGSFALYEFCDFIGKEKYQYDKTQQIPYMQRGNKWYTWENPESVDAKVKFAKSKQLAGVFVSSLDLDDSSNHCGFGKFPVMNQVNKGLIGKTFA